MDRLIIAKSTEILIGLVLISFGILCYGLGFIALIYGAVSLFLLTVLFVMFASGVELGWFWIKRFKLMTAGLTKRAPERFLARAASTLVWPLFLATIIKIVLAMLGLIVAYYYLVKYIILGLSDLNITWVIGYLLMVVVYFVLRGIYGKVIQEKFSQAVQKITAEYPHVSKEDGYLIIHLGKGFLEKYREIKISLNEIDEMKVMDRYEGYAFLKYVLGPDVEFGARSAIDKLQYQQGKIDRPRYFAYMENSTGAKTLFISGSKILYLIGVKEDVEMDKLQIINNK